MKREDAKNHLYFISKFAEGADIQWFNPTQGCWVDVDNPTFLGKSEYRIKPEPKFVPFTFEDAENLVGKVLRKKYGDSIELIVRCNSYGCFVLHEVVIFQELLEHYTFLDGSPCGKLVVEGNESN